jgi:hypothetical protein
MNINVLYFLHNSELHEDCYEEGYHISVTDAVIFGGNFKSFFVADLILFCFNIH